MPDEYRSQVLALTRAFGAVDATQGHRSRLEQRASTQMAVAGRATALRILLWGPNTNTLSFVGVPGQSYTIKFATNLNSPLWFPLATTNTDTNGRGLVQDTDATAPSRFYRVVSP